MRGEPSPSDTAGESRAGPAAALAVAGVLAVFFAPALLGAGEFVHRDTGRMHAPTKQLIGEELARGRLPEWNPYSGLGAPLVAGAVDAVQHPFTALFAVLPPGPALTAWVLLSFALAAAGAFAWIRSVGGSAHAAAAGAIAFALSGPLVSSSDNVTYLTTYAALPWLFAAAHRFALGGGPARLAAVGAASALCAAAGDPQAWVIALALLPVAGAAFASPGGRRAAALRGAGAAAAAALAALPFLLPVAAWYPYADRAAGLGGDDLRRWNLSPWRLPELVVPDLLRGDPGEMLAPVFRVYAGNDVSPLPWFLSVYLGASVVALAAAGAWRDRRARWLALGALAFAWAALGPHGGFQAVAGGIPLLGGFRYAEKYAVWVALCTAGAAALGLDALTRPVPSRALARPAAVAGAALLAVAGLAFVAPGAVAALAGGPREVGLVLAGNVASGAGRAGLVLGALAALAAVSGRASVSRAAPALAVALVAVDLFGGNAGAYVLGRADRSRPPLAEGLVPGTRVYSPFRPREDRWPELGRLASSAEWIRRTLGPAWNLPLRIGSHREYTGLRSARWTRYRAALGEGERMARLGLFGFGLLVVPDDPGLAAQVGLKGAPRPVAVDPGLPAWLVEMPHRPRAHVAGPVFEADADRALEFAVEGGEGGATALEGEVPAGYAPPGGDARIALDEPGETEVEVRSGGRALLVLSDLFAPGWTATVDGRPAAILRANGLVRAVWFEPGEHRIRFRYRTPGLREGWLAALCGASALAAWGLFRRRRARLAAA